MAEKNLYINQLLSQPAYFADLCNGTLFHGHQRLRPEDLTPVTDESGVVFADPAGMKKVLERRRDVTMRAGNGLYFAVIAVENQSDIHYAMPVRSMLYDALDYSNQIRVLEQAHRDQEENLTGAEFLSGIRKTDRLVPVVTIVLYWGSKAWDGCKSLHELLGFEDENEDIRELADYIPDYRINLINAADMEDPDYFRTHLQYIFGVLKCNQNKQSLYQYVRENRESIRNMDSTAKLALLSVIGEQKRLQKIFEEAQEEEAWDMCKAIDDLIADGEERGEERMATLINRLLDENRPDLIRQATSDAGVRDQLYQIYQL